MKKLYLQNYKNSLFFLYFIKNLALALLVIFCSFFISVANAYEKNSTKFQKIPTNDKKIQKTISVNFADLDINVALERFANFVDLDLVMSPNIKGKVTVNLKDVLWQEALDAILKTHNLRAELQKNILIIIPENSTTTYNFSPEISSIFIPIRYTKASEMARIILQNTNKSSSMLSSHGSVLYDDRTNTLIVRDKKSSMLEIQNFVQKLDVQIQQIMIQAKIVITTRSDMNSLGVNWGVRKGNISSSLGSAGANANSQSGAILQTLLPSSNLSSNHLGRIAFGFLSSADVMLDLELAALEIEGLSKIVSAPQIITTDRSKAIIKSGEQIPYQKTDKNGNVEVEFKDALLSLEVTPKIANNNLIGMQLKINKDNPGQRVGENFAIETNFIETQVFIKNGDTLVIGGIMNDTELESLSKVPFLGDIPILGNLFKRKENSKKNFELAVFITPKILTSQDY